MSGFQNLDHDGMRSHVGLLGWLHVIGSLFLLALGLFLFTLLTGIGLFTGEPEAQGVLAVVGTSLGGFLSVLAFPGLAAGWGLLRRASWARPLALVVGFLGLVNFPMGTLLGVYTFWVLLQDEAEYYFAPELAEDRLDELGAAPQA